MLMVAILKCGMFLLTNTMRHTANMIVLSSIIDTTDGAQGQHRPKVRRPKPLSLCHSMLLLPSYCHWLHDALAMQRTTTLTGC